MVSMPTARRPCGRRAVPCPGDPADGNDVGDPADVAGTGGFRGGRQRDDGDRLVTVRAVARGCGLQRVPGEGLLAHRCGACGFGGRPVRRPGFAESACPVFFAVVVSLTLGPPAALDGAVDLADACPGPEGAVAAQANTFLQRGRVLPGCMPAFGRAVEAPLRPGGVELLAAAVAGAGDRRPEFGGLVAAGPRAVDLPGRRARRSETGHAGMNAAASQRCCGEARSLATPVPGHHRCGAPAFGRTAVSGSGSVCPWQRPPGTSTQRMNHLHPAHARIRRSPRQHRQGGTSGVLRAVCARRKGSRAERRTGWHTRA